MRKIKVVSLVNSATVVKESNFNYKVDEYKASIWRNMLCMMAFTDHSIF